MTNTVFIRDKNGLRAGQRPRLLSHWAGGGEPGGTLAGRDLRGYLGEPPEVRTWLSVSLHICRICLQSGTQAERLGLKETTGTGRWILPQDGAVYVCF